MLQRVIRKLIPRSNVILTECETASSANEARRLSIEVLSPPLFAVEQRRLIHTYRLIGKDVTTID